MIGIGINENVYLSRAVLNDKDHLEFTFEEVDKVEGKAISMFDMLESDTMIEKDNGTTIRIFPPTPPKPDPNVTEEQWVDRLTADLNKTKGIIRHFLLGYMTTKDIEGKISIFQGLPIDKDNYNQQIQKKEILLAAHKNLARSFVDLIKPYLNKPELKFRLLLIRQSKDKNYPAFRGRYLEENPIWESMDVPLDPDPKKNMSKVKFTAWEISEGLTDSAPVAKDSSKKDAPQAPQTAASIFGS